MAWRPVVGEGAVSVALKGKERFSLTARSASLGLAEQE